MQSIRGTSFILVLLAALVLSWRYTPINFDKVHKTNVFSNYGQRWKSNIRELVQPSTEEEIVATAKECWARGRVKFYRNH